MSYRRHAKLMNCATLPVSHVHIVGLLPEQDIGPIFSRLHNRTPSVRPPFALLHARSTCPWAPWTGLNLSALCPLPSIVRNNSIKWISAYWAWQENLPDTSCTTSSSYYVTVALGVVLEYSGKIYHHFISFLLSDDHFPHIKYFNQISSLQIQAWNPR